MTEGGNVGGAGGTGGDGTGSLGGPGVPGVPLGQSGPAGPFGPAGSGELGGRGGPGASDGPGEPAAPGGPGGLGGGAGGLGGADSAGDDDGAIGADDIARLNGMAVERAGAFARLAGAGLIVAGAVGVLAWLWLSVRQQQRIDDIGGPFATSEDPSLVDRIDAFVDYVIFLPWSAVAIGAGFGLRLAADYTAARTGGSLTGFEVGDPVPDGGLSHEPAQIEVDPFA